MATDDQEIVAFSFWLCDPGGYLDSMRNLINNHQWSTTGDVDKTPAQGPSVVLETQPRNQTPPRGAIGKCVISDLAKGQGPVHQMPICVGKDTPYKWY